MKQIRLLFSVLAIILSITSYGQSYPVGVRTVTYTDASRSNRAIAVEVHYPALTSGNNTTAAADSFPFVVFGHGFQMTASAYYPFADTLAQRGYIVAFPTTEGSLLPSHPDFAQDLIYVYNGLNRQITLTRPPHFIIT
jgi:predicted dienelactone hydrolase